MKRFHKFLAVFVIVLMVTGAVFGATPGYRKSPGAGQIITMPYRTDPPKTFRLVRYMPASGTANSITLSADSIVIWDLISDDGVTVTCSSTSGDSAVAGVMAVDCLTGDTMGNTLTQDVNARNWSWLQTYGICNVKVAGGAGGALKKGSAFGTSSTGAMACAFSLDSNTVGGDPAVSTSSTRWGIAGFVFNDASSTAGAEVRAFVRCE